MSIAEIIRAWKDEEYRSSLSPEQLQNLPESPVGLVDLGDDMIGEIAGGTKHSVKPGSATECWFNGDTCAHTCPWTCLVAAC